MKHNIRRTCSYTLILIAWILLNLWVTFYQEKYLLIGDYPHYFFKKDYGNIFVKYAWSPSLSFVELNNFYKFHKVCVTIPYDIFIESPISYKLINNTKEIIILDYVCKIERI